MAADDIGATPGTGATFRAYIDPGGRLWPPNLASYIDSAAAVPGYNQPRVVTPQTPLPTVDDDVRTTLFWILRRLQYGLCIPDPYDTTDDAQGVALKTLIDTLVVSRVGAGNYDTFVTAIQATPTVVVGARPTRRLATFFNSGTVSVYLVGSLRGQTTAVPVAAGGSAQMAVTCPVQFIVPVGSAAGQVSGWEEFD